MGKKGSQEDLGEEEYFSWGLNNYKCLTKEGECLYGLGSARAKTENTCGQVI